MGVKVSWPETQMLQPMHSRISSTRPSSIFVGRNGSAIEGRAAPIMSSTPRRIWLTMVSGEVNQPTPTTGFVVTFFTNAMYGSCPPSPSKREVTESFSQSLTLTSQRSGSSASVSTISRPSLAAAMPSGPMSSSTARRMATAQRSPTASLVSSSSSRTRRIRFSSDPPYSSVRWLRRRWRKCISRVESWPA